MITLEQPSMALNDTRLPVTVQMWNTRTVQPTDCMYNVLSDVIAVAKATKRGELKNLVFNCHGTPAHLQIGDGIDKVASVLFKMLVDPSGRPLVNTIWFRSCMVARMSSGGDGNMFCSDIAQYARCNVVASTASQATSTGNVLPYGQLDSFEGVVICYGPKGDVSSWKENWSNWVLNGME